MAGWQKVKLSNNHLKSLLITEQNALSRFRNRDLSGYQSFTYYRPLFLIHLQHYASLTVVTMHCYIFYSYLYLASTSN